MCRSISFGTSSPGPSVSTLSRIGEPRPAARGGADGAQNPKRGLVVPVVKDVREHVGVAAGRDGLEEIAARERRPVGHAGSLEGLEGRGFGVRQVDDGPAQSRVPRQEPGKQPARPTANVDDQLVRPVELVERRELERGACSHRAVEDRGFGRMLGEPVEVAGAEDIRRRGGTGPERVLGLLPDEVVLVREALRDPRDRARHLRAQQLRLRRVPDELTLEREDLEHRQRPQDPAQRVDRQPGLGGKIGNRLVTVGDQVGDAGSRHRADRLRDHEAVGVRQQRRACVAHGTSTSFPNLPGAANAP